MKTRSSAALMVYLIMFLEGCSTIMVPANKDALMAHFGIGIEEISLLIALRGLISGVLPFVCGGLSDKFGRKYIIAAGLLLFIVYYFALPFLPAMLFLPILLFTVLLGCAHSLTDPASQAVLFDVYGDPSTKMPIIQVTYSAGAILMPMVVGFTLLRGYSWKIPFFLVAIVAVALLVMVITIKQVQKIQVDTTQEKTALPVFQTQPRIMREGLCLFLFVSVSLVFVSLVGSWVDLYMREVFAYSEAASVMVIGYFQAGCIGGALLFVVLLRRLHTTRIFLDFSVFALVVMPLCLWTKNPLIFIGLIVLLAGAAGAFFSLAISYAGNLFRAHAGAAAGAISSASSVGVLLASVLAGWLIPWLGVRNLFLCLPIILAIAALLAFLIRRQYKRLLATA